jgi:hypothetical protein
MKELHLSRISINWNTHLVVVSVQQMNKTPVKLVPFAILGPKLERFSQRWIKIITG